MVRIRLSKISAILTYSEREKTEQQEHNYINNRRRITVVLHWMTIEYWVKKWLLKKYCWVKLSAALFNGQRRPQALKLSAYNCCSHIWKLFAFPSTTSLSDVAHVCQVPFRGPHVCKLLNLPKGPQIPNSDDLSSVSNNGLRTEGPQHGFS